MPWNSLYFFPWLTPTQLLIILTRIIPSVELIILLWLMAAITILVNWLCPICLSVGFQFCKASVEPMGEESDHIHITALSDALGVPIRVVYLDRSSCDAANPTVNYHDFIPSSNPRGAISEQQDSIESSARQQTKPFITLLYRPGHYDILYPKWSLQRKGCYVHVCVRMGLGVGSKVLRQCVESWN